MSERAWHLLCEVIEWPNTAFYADLIERCVLQELADRGWVAIVRTQVGGFPRIVPTREGMHTYKVIN
jgi:hypothetical protein